MSAMVSVCRECGRQYPLPPSGRTLCLSCLVRERAHSGSVLVRGGRGRRGPDVRCGPPDRRRDRGRRDAADRRTPRRRERRKNPDRHILFSDRRYEVADRRGGLRSDRRLGSDRRIGSPDRRLLQVG